MDGIFSVVDLAHLGLSLEKLNVGVAAANIANVHNATYSPKIINKLEFQSLLEGDLPLQHEGASLSAGDIDVLITSEEGVAINLDNEVLSVTNAEMRYQAIAQMIQKKFGILELSMGVKK